jgi:hypothetical protein
LSHINQRIAETTPILAFRNAREVSSDSTRFISTTKQNEQRKALSSKTSKASKSILGISDSQRQPELEESHQLEAKLEEGSATLIEEEVFNKQTNTKISTHLKELNRVFSTIVDTPKGWSDHPQTPLKDPPPFVTLGLPLTTKQREAIRKAPSIKRALKPRKESVGSLLAKEMFTKKKFEKSSEELFYFKGYLKEIQEDLKKLRYEDALIAKEQINHMEHSLQSKQITHYDLKKTLEKVSKKIQRARDEIHTAFLYLTHIRP